MTNLSGKRIVSQPVLIFTEQFGQYSQTIESITISVDTMVLDSSVTGWLTVWQKWCL